ncbi:aldehyde dehydrogenase family protein [Bacillus kwashiorkori]|uniref:aldehyde dehydrogenase family protein n=1 Tax=Bacillus kwashiorkori TaxID=1522318 RepID=UPI000785897C|nr:aldehyde dehydrogenase family protein [Bacillus kwashiorkori]
MAIIKAMNPATGELMANIEETKIEQIHKLYADSRKAFASWSQLSIKERIGYLKQLKSVIVLEMDDIAKVIVNDTGKVPTEAITADIMPTIDALDQTIKHAEKLLAPKKVKTPIFLFGKKSLVEYMPRGVVLVISPWNYPLQLALVPVISALVSGNTVILKPSEVTPTVGKCMEELFKKANFPHGVVQVAHGGKEVGAKLTEEKPDYIFFTGSVQTGKIIQEVAAKQLIPTTLELGGKDPFIVFADANMERAAKAAVWAAFTNSGQVCMSAERIFVERTIFNKFLEIVKKETESLIQDRSKEADIGSMTFPDQKEIVKRQVRAALCEGAQLITGEHPDDWDESMFIKPLILTNITADMEIFREETFGPVLPMIPFDTEEEVINLANQSEYGLNASIFTSNMKKGRRVARKLISGAVVLNDVIVSVANHYLPFGGTKQSGIGRYHGEHGLTIFCHEKAIVVDRGKRMRELQWYPYKGTYEQFLRLFQSYFSDKRNWAVFLKTYLKLLKK